MMDLDGFARRISHVARGCPTAVISDAILQAAEDFCERTWLWVQTVSPVTTMEDTLEYSFVPPEGASIVAIASLLLGGSSVPFNQTARDSVLLFSDPGADNVLVADAVLKPSKQAKRIPKFLFDEWQDAIVSGARAKLLDMPGTDWFQPGLAEKYRSEFNRVWTPRAKVEVARGNRRPMRVNMRRFV